MAKNRRTITAAFKADVARLVISGVASVPDLAKKHKIHDSMLYNWVRQAKVDAGQGPVGALSSAEKEELGRLRTENRELRRERDFLTQAAAYFAKARK